MLEFWFNLHTGGRSQSGLDVPMKVLRRIHNVCSGRKEIELCSYLWIFMEKFLGFAFDGIKEEN
jgi:hypothetical protein